MPDREEPKASRTDGRWVRFGAMTVLLGGLALTVWVVQMAMEMAHQRGQAAWSSFAQAAATDVGHRLLVAKHALDGVVAMATSQASPDRAALQRLQSARPIEVHYPGVRAVGILAVQRARALPGSTATGKGIDPSIGQQYVVREVEPFVRQAALWGRDWSSDAMAAEVIRRALKNGSTEMGYVPASTEPMAERLVFLISPLRESGAVSGDPDLAFVVFEASDLLRDVPGFLQGMAQLTLVDDGATTRQTLYSASPNAVKQRAGAPRFVSDQALPFGGRILFVRMASTAVFEAQHDGQALALAIGAAGLLVSVMLSGAVWRVARVREQARLAHRTLAAELAQMAQVAQASREGMLGLDRQGHIRWCNPSALALLGLRNDALIGRSSTEVLGSLLPDVGGSVADSGDRSAWQQALEQGQELREDQRLAAPGGTSHQVQLQLLPLRDAEGAVIGFVLYLHDQTVLKETQASLELAEQEARSLWQAVQAHALVTVTDLQGRITDANASFCQVSGFTRDELLGQDHGVVRSGIHPPEFWAEMWRVIRSGEPWRGDVCNRSKAGDLFWVDSLVAPIRGADGLTQRYVCIRFVNTAAKRLAAKVEQERRMLMNVLAASHAGTWEIHLRTQSVEINDRWAAMLGQTVQALSPLTQQKWRELVHPDDLASVDAEVAAHLRGGQPQYECEFRLRHAEPGRWVWIHARGLVVERDDAGMPLVFAGIHTDVTERREAAEAQRNSQLLLSRIEQLAGVGGWQVDLRSNRSHWSEEALRLLSLDRSRAWQIEDILALMPEQHRNRQEQAIQAALASTDGWDLEVEVFTGDGRQVWMRSVGEAEYDDSGPVRLVGALADITARRRLEAEARRNLDLLRSVLDSLPCGVSAVAPDLSIVAYNQQLQRLLDIPQELLRGDRPANFEDIIRFNAYRGEYGELEDVEAEVQVRLNRALHPESLRYERVRPTGVVLEVQSEPMLHGGFVTVYNDITARRQAEAQVVRAEALLRGAIDTVNEAFVLFDPNDCLVICNDKYRQMYHASADLLVPGVQFEHVIREGVRRGQYADAVGQEEAWIAQRMAAHKAADTDSVQRLNDGRWVRVVERRMADGHTVGFRVDITDLVEARREAESAANAKGMFLANMSHEIRTPMNAILGMLELLQRTDLTERQRDYADKTQGAARSLLGLLNDILDFSKVEAGKMELDAQPFQVDRLLRDLSVILSANVGIKPIELLFDVDPALPGTLIADAPRLQQVLINLAGNAIKFTERGEVVLQLRQLSAHDGMVELEISVRDTGIGIAPEHQAQIFKGFTQAEASTSRRFGGTGLGLAISQRLVHLMGGTLRLESALGLGSRFAFVLQLPYERVVDTCREPLRVLLVDDNALARDIHGAMLRALGWSVDLASSGPEGVTMALSADRADAGYDAILIDWLMPEMDGWQVVQRLRSRLRRQPAPRLVMLTAQGRDVLQQRSEAEQRTLDGFLVKPITAPMVADMLHGLLHPETPTAAPKPSTQPCRLEGLRVLLAEDNPINQRVASELLTAEGAEVTVAADGRLAVDLLQAGADQFDVVLMDMQMPVMDGLMATRAIREQLGLTQLPIVAMTANAAASDRDRCLAAGMNAHVGKPFDLTQLIQLLLELAPKRANAPTGPAAPAIADPMAALRQRQVEAEALVDDVRQAEAAAQGVALREALGRMMGKTELFHRMVGSYAAGARGFVERIRQHQSVDDFDEGVQTFHGFKGLSATLGAVRLAAMAAEGESKARAREWPDEKWMATFSAEIERACLALERHSGDLRAAKATAPA